MGGVIGRGEDDPAPTDEHEEDWTTVDPGAVPPWRREDRVIVDAARAAAAAAPPEAALEIARELRRLAALHDDGVLSDAEYVAAARVRLAGRPRR